HPGPVRSAGRSLLFFAPVDEHRLVAGIVVEDPGVDGRGVKGFEVPQACFEAPGDDGRRDVVTTLSHALRHARDSIVTVCEPKEYELHAVAGRLPAPAQSQVAAPGQRGLDGKALPGHEMPLEFLEHHAARACRDA